MSKELEAQDVVRIPFASYQPVLAKASGLVNEEKDPFLSTLILSDEAKVADDGKWAWMDGQEINYFPMVQDGIIDLRTLTWDVDWENQKWLGNLPEGAIPDVHDVLFWMLTFTHPFIDFKDVSFDNSETSNLRTALNNPANWVRKPDAKGKAVFTPDIVPRDQFRSWGYCEVVDYPRVLSPEIKKQILESVGKSSPFAFMDPHFEILQPEDGACPFTPEELEIIANDEWPAPATEGKLVQKPGMIDLGPDAYSTYMRGVELLKHTDFRKFGAYARNYGVGFPIPETFQDTSEIEKQLLNHIGFSSKQVKIKYIRALFLLSHASSAEADWSIAYVDGKGSNKRKMMYEVKDWKQIANGADPLILLNPGEEPPAGYVESTLYQYTTMYLGKVWRADLQIDGKDCPPIYFTTEDLFIKNCVSQMPEIADKYVRGKELVYIMNGSWCERNFAGSERRNEVRDYHCPAINDRSVMEWIIGPMAHRMSLEKGILTSVEIYHPNPKVDIEAALATYNKSLDAVREQNSKNVNPELMALIVKQAEEASSV